MYKPVLLTLVASLLLTVATDVFADHWSYIPLEPRQPSVMRQTTGPANGGMIQQVGGVVSRGGAHHGHNASPPMPQRYPQMHAPMYPTPVPYVPVQVGGTVITNQAFAPQEMLYPHEYKSLYPPFYHKVSGHWWWTPCGIESHDKWELQGTEVKVKYRSSFAPFSGFFPPFHF
jgi:hypothetical protein